MRYRLRGHVTLEHLGRHYASHGYVAAYIGHRSSPDNAKHRWDRPHDVSALIDYFAERGGEALPEFAAMIDTIAVGHIGYSWGAYTAHSVAGGSFKSSGSGETLWNFRDERVVAIMALSPQGHGGFGAYDIVCQSRC